MKTPSPFRALVALVAAIVCASVDAYEIDGLSWRSGNIVMQLQLGQPPSPLIDGATHWDDVAAAALETWNPVLQRSQFTYVKNSTAAKARSNSANNVFFAADIYGQAFGNRVLAVTLMRSTGNRLIEADVVVNTANTWNSYRGPRGSRSAVDLQRVLVHEFGHALGLNHPDQASPPQSVAAIMNSTITNIYTLQNDDIAGAQMLYNTQPAQLPPPTLSGQTVATGAPLTLTAGGGYASYSWTFTRPGGSPQILLDGDGDPWTNATYRLFSAQPQDAGTYAVAGVTGSSFSEYASATVGVTTVNTDAARLSNLSARARAGSGGETFIAGFVVGGRTPKRVLVRALGPALNGALANPLANPRLTLIRHGADGANSIIAQNDDWSANSAEAAALRTNSQRLGASALADGSKDAAILVTLDPGVYSAQVDAQGGAPGIVLVEAYDADDNVTAALPRRLLNLSSRSFAGNGDETLIAGFVVDGNSPKQVLIRAVGPALAPAGVTDHNPDPNLQLFDGNGTRVADNDDWAYSNQTDILPSIFTKVGAGQLADGSYDSALLITLRPGVYSAQANGRSGETGVIVIEVYEVPQ
jgi:hypothetical protein